MAEMRSKLSGIFISLLGAAWWLLDWKGRLQSLGEIIQSMGGNTAMVADVVSSPLFGPGLVTLGLLFAIFVKVPEEKTWRHPALPILGWVIFGVVGVTMISLVMFGFFVSQSNIPVVVKYYNDQHNDRHVVDPGKTDFFESLVSNAPQIQNVTVAAVSDPEARQYATEFMYIFRYANIMIPSTGLGTALFPMDVEVSSTSDRGLVILLHDKDSPPDAEKLLETALTAGKIEFHTEETDWIPANATWLVAAPR
jgi:hypothetical protein